jgi:RNA polymerase sigma-70 factor (ECF subfamily)
VQDVESRWLLLAQRGDPEAFSQLIEAYQVPVYNLCHRMLGDGYEAEDAAQETFLRAYKSLRSYDTSRSFSTWLLSIAAHYCIDQIRRRRMAFVPFEALPYEEIADPSPNPEFELVANEEQRRVRALLDQLNPTDRAAVIMLYWYDFSYDEIAGALNLTVSAVKSRLHRARFDMAQYWLNQPGQNNSKERTRHGTNAQSPAF